MNIFESITSAAHSVLANRMRSILTMLGIIIGIAAVIMITSIGQGVQESVNDMFAGVGAGTLTAHVRHNMANPATRSDQLTLSSAQFLSAHPDIGTVSTASVSNARAQLRNPAETTGLQIIGTDENFRDVESVDMRFGRFLTEIDLDRAAPVIVINSNLARQIFGRADAVGETIRLTFWAGTVDLTIVGVFRTDDPMAEMFGMPTTAFIPITYFQRLLNRDNVVDQVLVVASDLDRLDEIALEISRLLSLYHNNEDRYQVTTVMSQVDMLNNIVTTITGFVGLVAFISLAVGGIGVMNIMLVSVTERTREIGIRKSLGATNGNILIQFLIEAMILTASGGVIGILLGYYGGFALAGVINLTPAVSVPVVAGTVIVSSLIGILFGVYPAWKAAKLDPIEALRYE